MLAALGFLAHHYALCKFEIDLLVERTDCLVRFNQLLPDRNILGAVLLALAAFYAEICFAGIRP